MTASIIIDAAPAQLASEAPAPEPTTGHGRSEASMPLTILLCSVLAEHTNAMSVIDMDISRQRVANIVKRVLLRSSHDDVLAWRTRVPATEWLVRWDAARKVTTAFYPELPPAPDLHALDNAAAAAALVPSQSPPS